MRTMTQSRAHIRGRVDENYRPPAARMCSLLPAEQAEGTIARKSSA
jgi:hypothetical protein